jgi:hypothetical protein
MRANEAKHTFITQALKIIPIYESTVKIKKLMFNRYNIDLLYI